MNKKYENPIIEIIEFDSENILTDSGVIGAPLPGDEEIDFWN